MNTAELALPMRMVGEPERAASNPEVVRLVSLARAGDRAADRVTVDVQATVLK